jgi:protein-tyrosine phosphatase
LTVRLIKVLFVCSGNICRSPTAEAVFRRYVVQAGLQDLILADSAGTLDYHIGEPPDPRTLEAARRRSYDLSGLCARQIRGQDFLEFDHLLAMDRGHLAALRGASLPQHRRKIRLFLDYAPHRPEREVPDPYYGTAAGFELVLDLVEDASRGLLASLLAELPRVSARD